MSEQLGQDPAAEDRSVDYKSLYKEAHPDAIEDPHKAEVMAHASQGHEEEVTLERQRAVDRAIEAGQLGAAGQVRDAVHMEGAADASAEGAERARQKADDSADFAGEIYDRTKNL